MTTRNRLLLCTLFLCVLVLAGQAVAANPILVITDTTRPFTTYLPEILNAEGMNAFDKADISSVTSGTLSGYDLVILGRTSLTAGQVSMFTTWVNAGGNLVAMRPDSQLNTLLGLAGPSGTMSNAYLQVDTSTKPGLGIVSQTIQYHGIADLYALNGATAVAMLYSDANTATTSPAVTIHTVGSGKAAAFAYDLARSVIYTRQGNPAWSGQERDGVIPIRPDDLFFGGSETDPQPDWVDLTKVAIPQADEQQRLLVNIILNLNAAKTPIPRFWYLPKGVKAAVVMTGDDHGTGGTGPRFDSFIAASPAGCSVADWECIRGTSYVYPETPIQNPELYVTSGFEIGLHVNTGCVDYSDFSDLDSYFELQLTDWAASFPGIPAPTTNRTHCVVWSDYDTQPKVELSHGIRLDSTYYYFPGTWINDVPGLFTGSGMPMRFATLAGNTIDVYQAPSQITDESDQSFPFTINTLLTNALGPQGYYGVFTVNMHTDLNDTNAELWSDQIVSAAKTAGVPVVSAAQMLQWLDGRNSSTFAINNWNPVTGQLDFAVNVGAGTRNLQAMLPANSGSSSLSSITLGGNPVSYALQTVKGVLYATFATAGGTYLANYSASPSFSISGVITPAALASGTQVTITGSENLTVSVDQYGAFEFDGVPAGDYTVTPSKTGFTFSPTSRSVTVSGSNVDGVDFALAQVPDGNSCPCSIWDLSTTPINDSADERAAVELGVRFTSDFDGLITGIRFYKGASNTGTHVGNLWSSTGDNLASAVFTNESASGWQEVSFAQPVPISANTTYVASYHTTIGYYAMDQLYFGNPYDNAPLHALANNGVFQYGDGGFPDQTYQNSNYWVDVVFVGPTYTVSGRISGPGGNLATVSLTGAATSSTITNASGNYAFIGIPNGTVTVTPTKPGYSFGPSSQTVQVNGGSVPNVNFSSAVQFYTISGTISGAGGNGATVTLTGSASLTTTADGLGHYTFSVDNGTYTVTPTKLGYTFTPTSQSVVVNGNSFTAVNFDTFVPTYSIAGQISGPGADTATVTLSGAASAVTTTDSSGNYSFPGLLNGAYTVTPSKTAYQFTNPSESVTLNGASVLTVNFTSVFVPTEGFPFHDDFNRTVLGGNYDVPIAEFFTPPVLNGATFGGSDPGTNSWAFVKPSAALIGQDQFARVQLAQLGINSLFLRTSLTADNSNVSSGYEADFGRISDGSGYWWAVYAIDPVTGFETLATSYPSPIPIPVGSIVEFHVAGSKLELVIDGQSAWTSTHAGASTGAPGLGVYDNAQLDELYAGNYTPPVPTYSISGNISGPGGNGAIVTLGGDGNGAVKATAAGDYSMTGIPNGNYTITPAVPGYIYTPTTLNVTVSGSAVVGANFTSVFSPTEAVPFHDDFNRTILGSDYDVIAGEYDSPPLLNGSTFAGTDPTTNSWAFVSPAAASIGPDQFARVRVVSHGVSTLLLRGVLTTDKTDIVSGYQVDFGRIQDGSGYWWAMYSITGGGYEVIDVAYPTAVAIPEGAVVEFRVKGTALELLVNGTSIWTGTHAGVTPGAPGLGVYDNAVLDDFFAGNF